MHASILFPNQHSSSPDSVTQSTPCPVSFPTQLSLHSLCHEKVNPQIEFVQPERNSESAPNGTINLECKELMNVPFVVPPQVAKEPAHTHSGDGMFPAFRFEDANRPRKWSASAFIEVSKASNHIFSYFSLKVTPIDWLRHWSHLNLPWSAKTQRSFLCQNVKDDLQTATLTFLRTAAIWLQSLDAAL